MINTGEDFFVCQDFWGEKMETWRRKSMLAPGASNPRQATDGVY